MELRGTTKLRSLYADKQDEGAFNCEGISGSLRPTSSARVYARRNIPTEPNYTRLRYAVIVEQLASGKRFKLAKLARRIGANITPAPDALSQLVQANAANANRRSGTVVRVPKPADFGELLKGRVALGLRFSITTPLHTRLQRIQAPPRSVGVPRRHSRAWSAGSPGHASWQDLVLHRGDHRGYGCCYRQTPLHHEHSRRKNRDCCVSKAQTTARLHVP